MESTNFSRRQEGESATDLRPSARLLEQTTASPLRRTSAQQLQHSSTQGQDRPLRLVDQLSTHSFQNQPLSDEDWTTPGSWNRNNNGAGRREDGPLFTSTGVEGRAAPMRPKEGECSVMVAAQNLMANYIPVFNPKGAIVDMYGAPHGPLDQSRYVEKVKGWSDAVEIREGRGGVKNGARNQNVNNAGLRIGGNGRGTAAPGEEDVEGEQGRGWQALAASMASERARKWRNGGGVGGGEGGRKGFNENRNAASRGFFQSAKDGSSPFRSSRGANRSSVGAFNNNNPNRGSGGSSGGSSGENTAANAQYEDDLGECLDYIDDEYKEARECAKNYHRSLTKIFATQKSNLQPGAPMGSRWNAFKNAFKTGKIAKCPELKLAKEFDAYEQVIIFPGSPLHVSVDLMSQLFGLLCASKEALEFDIKTKFLNPLFHFLDKEWKDVVSHDKAVQNLAIKIQKAKAEARDHGTIADMMELFKHERSKALFLFHHVLKSDYSQILKFEDLTDCYIDYHRENLELLEQVKVILRQRANAAKPEESLTTKPPPLGPEGGVIGCLGTCTVPCVPAPGLVTDVKADTREVELEMQRIYGAKLPAKPGDCGPQGFGKTCRPDESASGETLVAAKSSCGAQAGSAAFLQYMEKRIKTRPYGFVKEAYDATKPDEMTLHVGEMVYLRGKPGFDKYCGEKEDGTKGTFPQRALDVVVDIC